MEPIETDPVRQPRIRSWVVALVLGATLIAGGAASVFAASPSADPSASPGATSSQGTGSSGSTDAANCPAHSDASSSDAQGTST